MPTKVLAIDLIQVLGTVQPRATLNEDAIADYQEHYASGDNGKPVLPPLRCFFDGDRYILSRGFHRHTAANRAKRASLECEIIGGTERDAILDAMQDNSEHGVRLTPADKRKSVNRLLDDPEWGKLTQAKIAEMANVSLGLVRTIVAERKAAANEGKAIKLSTNNSGKICRKSKKGVKGGIKSAVANDASSGQGEPPASADDILAESQQAELDEQLTPQQSCDEHNKTIETFCRAITKMAEDCPSLYWLTDKRRYDSFVTKVKQGCTTLRSAKCVVCPECGGEGCDTCHNQGFLPKMMADAL